MKERNSQVVIKILLSTLLLICLLDMPYGYYQFVRFISFIGFGILAYLAMTNNSQTVIVIYASLALLFQPFFKISIGRELWNIVDFIVAITLIGSVFLSNGKEK